MSSALSPIASSEKSAFLPLRVMVALSASVYSTDSSSLVNTVITTPFEEVSIFSIFTLEIFLVFGSALNDTPKPPDILMVT